MYIVSKKVINEKIIRLSDQIENAFKMDLTALTIRCGINDKNKLSMSLVQIRNVVPRQHELVWTRELILIGENTGIESDDIDPNLEEGERTNAKLASTVIKSDGNSYLLSDTNVQAREQERKIVLIHTKKVEGGDDIVTDVGYVELPEPEKSDNKENLESIPEAPEEEKLELENS